MQEENSRRMVFVGNVVIPSDVDRAEYISVALRTNTVCVQTTFGEFIKNVPVVQSFMGINDGFIHALEFPKTPKELGSQVVCLSIRNSRIPLVIGCLAKRNTSIDLQEEGQLKLYRVSSTGNYIIEGSAINGILDLMVNSDLEDGGKIRINASNKYKTGEIKLVADKMHLEGKQLFEALSAKQINMIVENILEGEEFSKLVMERTSILLDALGITIGDEGTESVSIKNNAGQSINVLNNQITIDSGSSGAVTIKGLGTSIDVDDAGVNIITEGKIYLGGGKRLLYAISDSSQKIQDVNEIGISNKSNTSE